MLQDVRKSMQGTTAKVIVWLIAGTFALFGVESIVGGIGGEPEVAEVNGEGIAQSEFAIAVERKKRQLLMQMGEHADPDLIDDSALAASVLDGLVQEKALQQDAGAKGLYMPSVMIDEYIRGMQEFQIDGQFSNERLQSVLSSAGFTLNGFRDSLSKQFLIEQSRSALIGSAFVLDAEQDALLKLDRQTRTFGMTTLNQSDYLDQVTVDESELLSYYEANQDEFVQPESVDVTYITLTKDSLLPSVEVAQDEIESRYEQELQDFVGEEERRAAHILIAIDDTVSEEDAKAKAAELKSQIDAGADFSELAKSESKDEGSAVAGGDLGFSGKGVYVSEFEDAMYALQVDEVSAPIKTQFGYHLIKLIDIQVNEAPTLEERAASIEEELISEKLLGLYVDMGQQLADISYSSSNLEEPAEELELVLNEKFSVSRDSQDPIFSNVKVQRALFDPENLSGENNSELIEVDDNTSLVFHVSRYNDESVKTFESVQSEISTIVQSKKATEYAASLAKAFIVRVDAGEQAGLVAEDMGFVWEQKSDVRRDDFAINADLLFKVFAMSKPEGGFDSVEGFELSNGDYSVVALSSAADGQLDDVTLIEKSSITSSLSSTYGGSDYSSFLGSIDANAVVEKL